MKSKLISISSYLLMGLIFLGVIIVYGVSNASVFNYTFFFLGLGLIIGPGLILYFIFSTSENKSRTDNQKTLDAFKRNSDVIEVNLSDCIIKSNSWTEEKERYNNQRIQAWNTLGGDSEKNIKTVQHNTSTILYTANYKGQEQIFESGLINKDKVTLSMLLEHQGRTKIHVDRSDSDNYYFDLEFLRD